MAKLFSNSNKKFLNQVEKPEKELNKFICDNWGSLFPNYIFIASEFPLKGNVRSLGNNGRIDILGYNPNSRRFVIFELKKDYDKNITDQSADYRDYVQDNFSDVYLHSTQKYGAVLPKFTDVAQDKVEIILIAKKFSLTQLERVKKQKENLITLIKYYWFENDLIFIDYINNDPDDQKIEATNTKKLKEIRNIIEQDPEIFETDKFFGLLTESKDMFWSFINFLKTQSPVNLDVKQTKIAIRTDKTAFSAIKKGGKGGRRALLQINTDIDVMDLQNQGIQIDDRRREGERPKGSLGLERYEVFIRDDNEMELFCNFLIGKI